MNPWLTLPIGLAIAAGFAIPAGLFVLYGFVRQRSPQFVTVTLFWLIGVGAVLSIAATGRNWNAATFVEGYYASSFAGVWMARMFNLTAVALAVMEVLRRRSVPSTPTGRGPFVLWLAFLLLFASWLISAFAGTKPRFPHSALYPVLVLTAVYVQPPISVEGVITHAKRIIALMLYLSLLAALASPDLVIERGYRGLIPGVGFRLHGLATHANSLGPLALVYLLLEYWVPTSRGWRLANTLVAIVVMILAQSKTAWLAAIATFVVLGVVHVRLEASRGLLRLNQSGSLVGAAAVLIAVPLAVLSAVVLQYPIESAGKFLLERAPGLATLTGRDVVWQITLKEWRANPLFGFGPSLWDVEFRVSHGLLAVGQAHNQFVQTLGESGLLGLVSLLFYIGVLAYYAVRSAASSKGVTLALVLVLLLRCATEAPFRMVTFLDPAFLTHLIVFAVLIQTHRAGALARQAEK